LGGEGKPLYDYDAIVQGFLSGKLIKELAEEFECCVDTIAQAVNITPNDCLILFSYERYADMAIKLADIAHRFGAKIIAVTDKITSPIAEGADVVFLSENDGGSFFNSSIALLMIAEMLALVASKDRYSEIESHLDLIDEYLAKGNLY
jgi:DNA-binding MurR/RpiR family transcriptional regulator